MRVDCDFMRHAKRERNRICVSYGRKRRKNYGFIDAFMYAHRRFDFYRSGNRACGICMHDPIFNSIIDCRNCRSEKTTHKVAGTVMIVIALVLIVLAIILIAAAASILF